MRSAARHRRAPSRHRAPRWRGLGTLRLLLAGVAAVAGGVAVFAPASAGGPPAHPVADPAAVVLAAGPPQALPATAPTRVRVPGIGVDSELVRLGLDAAGALTAPADPGRVGWFAEGPAPGDVGPAVLAGHVDSTEGPAVFYRLRELAPGDEVVVDRYDGTAVRFTVTRVDRYPKDEFPARAVYGPTPDAQLRLITCGGEFDRAAASYRDNVVVYAAASPPAAAGG